MKFRNLFKKKKKAPLHVIDSKGIIHLNKTREQQEADMNMLGSMAEKVYGKCNKCQGKGHDGWHTTLNQYVPCQCVTKLGDKARKEKEEHSRNTALFQAGRLN